MKNIYIFGNEKFNKNIKSLLVKNEIEEFEIIDSNEQLQETIKKSPKECYLIDNEKIYTKKIFHKYIKYIRPKNSVEKSFLKEHSILQLEFESSQKAIDYIKIRYNDTIIQEIDETNTQEIQEPEDKSLEISFDEEDEKEIIEIDKKKDPSSITQIDEIELDEINSVVSDIQNKG